MELSFDRLGLTLGGRRVLAGVSATLKPGRVTVILGPNGAGKSSLVRTAAGLIAPSEGHARLDGQDVAALDPRVRARAIGYLPQEAGVHWNVSVRDVVALGRLPHHSPFAALSPADHAAIETALIATDTAHFAGRAVHTLSGGERARVLFARVLAGEPRWLIADEPLASLDPAHQFALLDLARRAADDGAGVVLVLHDLAHALRVADDVVLLDGGRLAGLGAAGAVLTREAIAATFGIAVRFVDGGMVLEGPLAR